MVYSSLSDAVNDLQRHGMLLRITKQVDPHLEMAEIHRQVFDKGGPAILFENIKGSPFKAVSNIYGSYDRTEFLFRKNLPRLKKVIDIKADPTQLLKKPLLYLGVPFTAFKALPMRCYVKPPSMHGQTKISQLPLIKSWPMDGGAFVTLPQVFSLPPGSQNIMHSNIGMYRIQLSGNDYTLDQEIGLHYQLHRGIGVHHQMYNETAEQFKVSIFIGGPPSHAFSAIMPMPENITELTFAGMLGGRRFRYYKDDQGFIVSGDADFVITGVIEKNAKKLEGPFGDHLGYYSLAHPFPVMKVHRVYHRKDPLWHFSVVGRPPQEDSSFGYLIHKIVKNLTTGEFPGLKALHAVDVAGVHPLLLAIGKERYMPFREKKPEEILTIANRILGSGQTSLAKYLIIASDEDDPQLDIHDIPAFFNHVLERIQWERDLHFHTKTTIDTLDYSGEGWNEGSKVVLACRGKKIRELGSSLPTALTNCFNQSTTAQKNIALVRPGIIAIQISPFIGYGQIEDIIELKHELEAHDLSAYPLIVLVDDCTFISESFDNFLWAVFTRSNPSHDIYGVKEITRHKHWGCIGPLIIDARKKPHHAPELEPDIHIKTAVKSWLAEVKY